MASITDLPVDVLLKIFQFYSQTESHGTLLSVIGKVCESWKNTCLDSSLWEKFDGTPSFEEMMYLSKNGSLEYTKELIVSFTRSLKSSSEENKNLDSIESIGKTKELSEGSSTDTCERITEETELFQSIKNVEVISFAKVVQISDETLSILAQNCPKLREIKIGMSGSDPNVLTYQILVDFFSLRGCGITKIDICYCKLPNFTTSMRCIADCCPNLEYLHLMNIQCSQEVFPTSYFQRLCSKLKSLYLDDNIRIGRSQYSSGFPDLEEFVCYGENGLDIKDFEFDCVLFNSPKLRLLNLTKCDVSSFLMLQLPACSVQCLYIPRTKACGDEYLADLLKKWSHSLKEVDLSYGGHAVQNAVLKLIKTPKKSPLERLILNFTPVKVDLVENIVKYCSNLENLKLEGCVNMMDGIKRAYYSKLELEELAKKLDSLKSVRPPPEIFTIDDL